MTDLEPGREWRLCVPFFRKRLLTGELSAPAELLAVARVDGRKAWRRASAAERADYVASEAW